jgi:hypothetical protein
MKPPRPRPPQEGSTLRTLAYALYLAADGITYLVIGGRLLQEGLRLMRPQATPPEGQE